MTEPATQQKTFGQFVMGVFSEPEGTPSFSRLTSFLFIAVMLLMDVMHFWKTGQMPDWQQLLGQGFGGSAAYGINKLGGVLTVMGKRP